MGAGGADRSSGRRLDAVAFVVRNRNLCRLHLGRLLWQSADLAQVVALLVFAYDRGGASEVALFGVIRTAAAAVSVPFVAVLGDRLPRIAVLAGGAALGAAALAGAALATAADLPSLVVYAMSAGAAIAMAVFRPTSCALVPSLVQKPAELVAHNVVGTFVEGATALAGPVLGAALVAGLDVPGALAATSVSAVLVAGMFGTMRRSVDDRTSTRPDGDRSIGGDLVAGFRQIGGDPTARLLTLIGSAQTLVRGALNVLVVVLAVDLLDLDESATGVLLGALGVGSLLGGFVTLRLASGDRLGRLLALGITLWGAPIAVAAFTPVPVLAVLVLSVIGVGNNLVDVSLFTMLQRSVPNEVLSRVMGALETALQVGMALGALVAAGALAAFGDRGALVAVGALLPVLALVSLPKLRSVDRRSEVRDADVALLQGVPLFQVLPLVDVELLANRLSEPISFETDQVVIRSGDTGDRYYVVQGGAAEVSIDGGGSTLGPGDGFGEIALLRDVPRTATVRAGAGLEVRTLDRRDFLAVVTGHPGSDAVAREVVDQHLTRGVEEPR
jgi:predicted MFS family arabinose efflux permease